MPALARLAMAGLLALSLGSVVFADPPALNGGTLTIAGQTFKGVQTLATKYHNSLSEASDLTDSNGIDEIYVKDEAGQVHLVYGYYNSLDTQIRRGFRGSINGHVVEVVHVNNELNTGTEGFFSSFDDIKKLLGSLVDEHFLKTLTGAGILSVAGMGSLLAKHATAGAAARAFVSMLGPTLVRGSVYGLGAMAGYVALKTLWNIGKRIYLERSKNNLHTIAMVTATSANDLHRDVTVPRDQRREGTPVEVLNETLRRSSGGADGTTGGGDGTSGERRGAVPAGRGNGAGTTRTPGPPILGADPSDMYSDLPRTR